MVEKEIPLRFFTAAAAAHVWSRSRLRLAAAVIRCRPPAPAPLLAPPREQRAGYEEGGGRGALIIGKRG